MAIALLLQAHRRLTAPELARRLDVSERTIRRDLDALLPSGLPLYSERGRGGGWALLDGPAINLSALTSEEAQALFLVTGPALLAGLGLEQGITSAFRKPLATLPADTREQADRLRPINGKPVGARRFAATFTSVHEAACELIYLGDGVQVLEPGSVRAEPVRIGHRLIPAHAPIW